MDAIIVNKKDRKGKISTRLRKKDFWVVYHENWRSINNNGKKLSVYCVLSTVLFLMCSFI